MKRVYRIACDTSLGVLFTNVQTPEKRWPDILDDPLGWARGVIADVHKLPIEEVTDVLQFTLVETRT